jgi:hypothetical protein
MMTVEFFPLSYSREALRRCDWVGPELFFLGLKYFFDLFILGEQEGWELFLEEHLLHFVPRFWHELHIVASPSCQQPRQGLHSVGKRGDTPMDYHHVAGRLEEVDSMIRHKNANGVEATVFWAVSVSGQFDFSGLLNRAFLERPANFTKK